MSRFDDITKLPDIQNDKTKQLENAIRQGQIQNMSKGCQKRNNESFSSSSSDDEIDDSDMPNKNQPKILVKRASDLADKYKAKKRASVAVKKHYMTLNNDELCDYDIIGFREKTAKFLMSKPVDITLIALIIFYTIMVLIFLAFDDSFYDDNPELELTVQITELLILFIFC